MAAIYQLRAIVFCFFLTSVSFRSTHNGDEEEKQRQTFPLKLGKLGKKKNLGNLGRGRKTQSNP